jgi:excinuclease ABC subunit B
MYADRVTPAMQKTIDETLRRRAIQLDYNAEHGITPQTIVKAIRTGLDGEIKARKVAQEAIHANESEFDLTETIRLLEEEMLEAARGLEFERAAHLRDKLNELKGAPIIKTGDTAVPGADGQNEPQNIWQPRSKGRGKGKRIGK